jgi:regulatory protein
MKDAESPVIIGIHLVSRGSARRRVELNTGETFSVDSGLLTRFDLRIGRILDAGRRESLLHEDARIRAKSAAFDLLRLRSHSAHEIAARLRRKGFADAVIEETLASLKELGYVADETFAQEWVESRRRHRPRGVLALRRELERKGIDGTTIERTLRTVTEGDERETALEVARRQYVRYRTLPREVARRRLYEFLLRRGFTYELARDVLREVTGVSVPDLD